MCQIAFAWKKGNSCPATRHQRDISQIFDRLPVTCTSFEVIPSARRENLAGCSVDSDRTIVYDIFLARPEKALGAKHLDRHLEERVPKVKT